MHERIQKATEQAHSQKHTHASPGFGTEAVELVFGVQRPHRLAADSMIHKRPKERQREGVSEKSVS